MPELVNTDTTIPGCPTTSHPAPSLCTPSQSNWPARNVLVAALAPVIFWLLVVLIERLLLLPSLFHSRNSCPAQVVASGSVAVRAPLVQSNFTK